MTSHNLTKLAPRDWYAAAALCELARYKVGEDLPRWMNWDGQEWLRFLIRFSDGDLASWFNGKPGTVKRIGEVMKELTGNPCSLLNYIIEMEREQNGRKRRKVLADLV